MVTLTSQLLWQKQLLLFYFFLFIKKRKKEKKVRPLARGKLEREEK